MLAPELMLNDLPWEELLKDMRYLLDQDIEILKGKREYYRRLITNPKADEQKLNRLYDSIERDQQRFDFFNELICRMETLNFKMALQGIDFCIESEKRLVNRTPEDYIITIRKEGLNFKTFYQVLKYSPKPLTINH